MIDSVLPFLFSKFVCCLALAYTGPTSYLRPFSSLLVAVCCFLSAQSTLVGMVPGFIGGEYVIGFVLQANNLLCLSKSAPAANLESSGRLRWASYEVFNHRGGLPDQQIPLFDKNSPQRVPSRRSFLLHQLSKIVLAGAAIFLLTTVQPSLEIDDWLEVPSGFLRRLPSLSSKEALIRVYMAFITHAVPYASLQAAHALSACIAVAYGDSPTHWRPIFGDIQDAWSMRNYYRYIPEITIFLTRSNELIEASGILSCARPSPCTQSSSIICSDFRERAKYRALCWSSSRLPFPL